jgi:5-methyltetrahydropteroyltriglutamate--homocysteine methyltransferase
VKRSEGRILTTHVGSLPRPPALLLPLVHKDAGDDYDRADTAERVSRSVRDVVRRQADIGIDVVNDGEHSKSSFAAYARGRLGGLSRTAEAPKSRAETRDLAAFPAVYAEMKVMYGARHAGTPGRRFALPPLACTGPITYAGGAELAADLANLKAALGDVAAAEAFVTSISSTNLELYFPNKYYGTDEEYQTALADALNVEYRAIVDAGFVLQIDDPMLATHYSRSPDASIEDCRRFIASRVACTNYALRGIPPEKVRYHTCYSINVGPRVHELGLEHYVDLMLQIDAGAYSIEASNPRHEHEWQIWQDVKLPDGKLLIPGVVSHCVMLVEHPDLVAQRIVRFAGLVGRERVIASNDCGFATSGPPRRRLGQTRSLGRRVAARQRAIVGRQKMRAGMRAPALSLLVTLAGLQPVLAADFYAGKTVTMSTYGPPGDSYDLYLRLLARHFGRHIAGNPGMIVVNQTGAGGLVAINNAGVLAPQDGTFLTLASQALLILEATGQPGLRRSLNDFHWLGSFSQSNNVTVTWGDARTKTLQDASDHEVVVGASGAGGGSVIGPLIYNAVLGTKFKLISGYQGGTAINLAMRRGEVEGRGNNIWAAYKAEMPDEIRTGILHVLIQTGLRKEPDLPDVPCFLDLVKGDPQREPVAKFMSYAVSIARPFAAPPGVPANRVTLLRRAFDDTMKDPAFLADAAKEKLEIDPLTGEQVQDVVGQVLGTPKPLINRIQAVLGLPPS